MSQLPGMRHRTMAPTSVLREGDVAAMEAANTALQSGAHALMEQGLDALGGYGTGWAPMTAFEEMVLEAASAAAYRRYSLGMFEGSILAAIDFWIWQEVAGAPLTTRIACMRPQDSAFDVMATDVREVAINQYVKRTIGLVNATQGRPLGWVIPSDHLQHPEIRITSGSAGDRVTGLVMWFQRTP